MSDSLALTLAGETVWLHGDRALFYPGESALLVADTHFGKGAFLRRQGLALPGGQSAADLDRLSALIERFRPARLIVLGDFFHQLHHRYFECNYGSEEIPLDRWFGSFHDGTREATARIRARKKRLFARS